jgi:hypothetical protein
MRAMTPRERFHAVMDFGPFDRLPVVEWAPWWDETIDRWRGEGLPAGLDGYDINRHFGLEVYRQCWLRCQGPACPHPARHGAGIVSTLEDYERIRENLYPVDAVDRKWWQNAAAAQRSGNEVIWLTLDGFFWLPRVLLGIEGHFYALYDKPELIHRINSDLADFQARVIEEACAITTPDFMTFAEDMSYNHGPMLSRAKFDELMLPYYNRIIPLLKARGILTIVDSDGDVTAATPWFEEAGLDGILPLERASGVDVGRLRRTHPEMRFLGAFDKMTMSRGEQAMRAEFERLLPVAAQGGLVVGCDHQTPPGVSYEDYRLYLRLSEKYARKAAEFRGRA